MVAFSVFVALSVMAVAAENACEADVQSAGNCMLQTAKTSKGTSKLRLERDDEEFMDLDTKQDSSVNKATWSYDGFSAGKYWNDMKYIIGEDTNAKYGPHAKHKYEAYWPKVAPPPSGWLTVIFVHGMGGNSGSFRTQCKIIVKTGRACVSLDYDESSKKVSTMAVDVSSALDDIIMNSAHYSFDPNRIIVIGSSRGGFITKTLMDNKKLGDYTRMHAIGLLNGIGGTMKNPTYKLPIFLMSCENDNIVKYKYTEQAYAAYQAKGVGSDVQFTSYKKCGHSPKVKEPSFYEAISKYLSKFDKSPPPSLGPINAASWPQVAKDKTACTADVHFTGITQATCQSKAIELGHQYYQYLSASQECSTLASCDNMLFPLPKDKWQVFWRPQPEAGSGTPAEPEPKPDPSLEEENYGDLTIEEVVEELEAEWEEEIEEEEEQEEEASSDTTTVASAEPASTTENRFCKNECYTQTQDWVKKCTFNKCKECPVCIATTTAPATLPLESTTENRFCKNECYAQTQDWLKKCKWNKCKECSECV